MPTNTPPLQCRALSTATDDECGRDTYTTIEIGLVTTPAKESRGVMVERWEIVVEVPVCDAHEVLLSAVESEVEPLVGVEAAAIAANDYRCLPTFRMTVNR